MSVKHDALRYAHDEGHTDVSFSEDGTKFITCGADGDIRIWSSDENEDPVHNCVGESAFCLRQKGDNLYVSTGSNDVQILTYPEGERNGVLDRFVAPINHIAVSKNTQHIALAGEDMEVKLIDLERSENKVSVFDGLKGPCLSVAIAPSFKFLAASCGDGKLRVWGIDDKALVKEVDCFPKVNSFSNAKNLCRLDFEPTSGKLLAYPEKNSIVLLDTSTWSPKTTLTSSAISSDFSLVHFSPCGKFLAASSVEGDFAIFNVTTGKISTTSKHPNSKNVCGLVWNPSEKGQIVYTDIEGQLGIMSNCVEDDDSPSEEKEGEVDFGEFQFEDDDEDDENVVSVEKLKRQVMGDSESELNFDVKSPTPRPRTPEIPLQSCFMPSSTPEHLNPRYLCWNEVGVIRSYSSEEESKSIEIEFHDFSFHSSIMLQNYHDYVMASVSKSAVVAANSNQIYVIPLSVNKEWTLKIDDENDATVEIVSVAVSENLVCFATNNYTVRVCSIFGTQRGVVSIPGPVVSMTAFQNSLLVAYHSGGVRKGDQCISMKLINFAGLMVQNFDIASALGPESTLLWLGFTDCGTPAMMDSLGMFSLYPKNSNIWIPFCDTSKHKKSHSDGFFPTSVAESCQVLAGIKCKGSFYPTITPRPTICELPLEPPFVELNTEKTQMEANLFTWSNLQVNDVTRKFTETGLKTFALACRNDLDQRALEFVDILGNPQVMTLAVKYAAKLNKKILAEKLMEMAARLTSEEGGSTDFCKDYGTPETNTKSLNTRKLTLSSIKKTPKYKLGVKEKEPVTPEVTQEPENQAPDDTFVSTGESIVSEEPKNPFLKNVKKAEGSNSPLSLTNKFAGVEFKSGKDASEKRKNPETEAEKPRENKQRKLDKFMFKRN